MSSLAVKQSQLAPSTKMQPMIQRFGATLPGLKPA
jgi:hypothetical protein